MAHAPLFTAGFLIQLASKPRSAKSIDSGFRRESNFPAGQTWGDSPGLNANCAGKPLLLTTAWILLSKQPRDLHRLAPILSDAGSRRIYADHRGIDHSDSGIVLHRMRLWMRPQTPAHRQRTRRL